MKINTLKIQDMVTRAYRGASEDKLLPITSMMNITLVNNHLSLTTTDTANTLVISCDGVEGDDLQVTVPAELFTKLVTKITSEKIKIELIDDNLTVVGNGSYKIPVPMDEEGPVQFPGIEFDIPKKSEVIQLSTINHILKVNKASIAKSVDLPHLCGYYIADKIVTTDEEVVCFNNIKLLEEVALISPRMMELLALSTDEKLTVYRNFIKIGKEKKSYMLVKSEGFTLCGPEQDDIQLYPIDEINEFLDIEFASTCKLPKLLLQSVIDRLSLFIEPYDKNGADFTFTRDGVKIASKKSSSSEIINYSSSENFTPFVCCIDIPMLKAQIDAIPGEVIELSYGCENAIKVKSGNVTQIMALLEDESLNSRG